MRKKFALVCGHWLCEQCANSDCGKCAKKPRRAAEQKRDEEEYPGRLKYLDTITNDNNRLIDSFFLLQILVRNILVELVIYLFLGVSV